MDITPDPGAYDRVIGELLARVQERRFRGLARITEAFRVEYYGLVNRVLIEERQVLGCYAGWASAQIHADGTVWPCCVRADSMGNLRDVGYDFRAIWSSQEAKRVRASIFRRECYCPLANAAYTNMLHHPVTLVKVGKRVLVG
jgi:MoaA/NifB/PqqE/SkfB family radical SAM enzyme